MNDEVDDVLATLDDVRQHEDEALVPLAHAMYMDAGRGLDRILWHVWDRAQSGVDADELIRQAKQAVLAWQAAHPSETRKNR